MTLQVIRHFGLQMLPALRPILKKCVQLFQLNEKMHRAADFGSRSANGAFRVDEFGGRIGAATLIATVTVLILRFALRTSSFDKSICKKCSRQRIEQLTHFALHDQTGVAQRAPELFSKFIILGAIGAAVVIKGDIEAREIALVTGLHFSDHFNFAAAFAARSQHDRSAVGVVGTDKNAAVAEQFLKPHPNIGLDVLDQMPDVNRTIGVGQCSGNEYFASRHRIQSCSSVNCGEKIGQAIFPCGSVRTAKQPEESKIRPVRDRDLGDSKVISTIRTAQSRLGRRLAAASFVREAR